MGGGGGLVSRNVFYEGAGRNIHFPVFKEWNALTGEVTGVTFHTVVHDLSLVYLEFLWIPSMWDNWRPRRGCYCLFWRAPVSLPIATTFRCSWKTQPHHTSRHHDVRTIQRQQVSIAFTSGLVIDVV